MGRIATKSAEAQQNLQVVETALERTQSALRAAEAADLAAEKVVKKSRKLLKWLLVLTILGVIVFVLTKLLTDDDDKGTEPYSTSRQ